MAGRQNVHVMITARNPGGFIGMMRGTPVDAAGNFDIRNVTPSAYMLTATVNVGNTARQGRLPVDVGGSARRRSQPTPSRSGLTATSCTESVCGALFVNIGMYGPPRNCKRRRE
jgi:hypothetical protein